MNITRLIEEYIENPEKFYEKHSSIEIKSHKNKSKNVIYLIEELFAGMKISGLLESSDDQRIAEIVDSIRNGEFHGDIGSEDVESIRDVILSLDRMSKTAKKDVPEVLMSMIDRTLTVPDKKQIPSLIVRLTGDGIKTIMSGINGMNIIPHVQPAMRSHAAPAKEYDSIQIDQMVEDNKIHYNILKESDDDIMLTMNFPDKIGRCRVFLKENERIIHTENLSDGENSVNFRKLKPGFYDISITGFINHSLSILVDR